MMLEQLTSLQLSEIEAYLRIEAQPETEQERKAAGLAKLKGYFRNKLRTA